MGTTYTMPTEGPDWDRIKAKVDAGGLVIDPYEGPPIPMNAADQPMQASPTDEPAELLKKKAPPRKPRKAAPKAKRK
jgi:hypothetical protein